MSKFSYYENGKKVVVEYTRSEVIEANHYRAYLANGKILDFKGADIDNILWTLRNKGVYDAQFDINAGRAKIIDQDIVFVLEEAVRLLQNEEERKSGRCF